MVEKIIKRIIKKFLEKYLNEIQEENKTKTFFQPAYENMTKSVKETITALPYLTLQQLADITRSWKYVDYIMRNG
jgi:ribosomal protein S17E